eukprot:1392789-Amorphochlora_amoeboformis.AAC.1
MSRMYTHNNLYDRTCNYYNVRIGFMSSTRNVLLYDAVEGRPRKPQVHRAIVQLLELYTDESAERYTPLE